MKSKADARSDPQERLVARAAVAVSALRRAALDAEREFEKELALVVPSTRDSARNLVHYLAVRRHDIRPLQEELARLGLSSLGRMESHVMSTLNAVLGVLHKLQGEPVPLHLGTERVVDLDSGTALLALHAKEALGPPSAGCGTRIMVTMPGEASESPRLIANLLASGMNIMHINCAHDDRHVWERFGACTWENPYRRQRHSESLARPDHRCYRWRGQA